MTGQISFAIETESELVACFFCGNSAVEALPRQSLRSFDDQLMGPNLVQNSISLKSLFGFKIEDFELNGKTPKPEEGPFH